MLNRAEPISVETAFIAGRLSRLGQSIFSHGSLENRLSQVLERQAKLPKPKRFGRSLKWFGRVFVGVSR